MKQIFDVSVLLHAELPVWPTSPKVDVERIEDMADGATANVSHLSFNAHSGTHIDAPLHFVHNAKTTEEIPLHKLIGPCRVVDARGIAAIDAAWLDQHLGGTTADRLLFKTDNSPLWEDMSHAFREDFVSLTLDAAEWMVQHNVQVVGIDYLSIQRYHDHWQTHIELLSNEVVVIETLDLRAVEPGAYELICLPLKVHNVEGVPARVVLREL